MPFGDRSCRTDRFEGDRRTTAVNNAPTRRSSSAAVGEQRDETSRRSLPEDKTGSSEAERRHRWRGTSLAGKRTISYVLIPPSVIPLFSCVIELPCTWPAASLPVPSKLATIVRPAGGVSWSGIVQFGTPVERRRAIQWGMSPITECSIRHDGNVRATLSTDVRVVFAPGAMTERCKKGQSWTSTSKRDASGA